jgi:hypothetical protein
MANLLPREQAILFLYLLQKGIPEWASKDGEPLRMAQERVFARLLNIPIADAQKAFIDAMEEGHVDIE